MESIKILAKGIFQLLLLILKNIISISIKFLILLKKYLLVSYKWLSSPKVLRWTIPLLFFGLSSAYVSFRYFAPQVTISVTEPPDKFNALTSFFTIENQGNCNIYDIKIEHKLDSAIVDPFNEGRSYFKIANLRILNRTRFPPVEKRIAKHRKKSIEFDFFQELYQWTVFNDSMPFADNSANRVEITMFVEFKYWQKPYWSGYIKRDTFKFKTTDLVRGKVLWLYK